MELAGERTHAALDEFTMEDLFYSFGTNHPGQLVLHNYPNHLRALNNGTIDLATIDILRDRERGVPRYNDFRRSFRLPPAIRFEDFSDDPSVVEQLSAVYDNPELVDLMVGLYAEKKPDGFAFSDTAFRVFILMASRRLNSDRFFTYDYNEDKYTKEGLAWIEENTLSSVLARHYPELKPTLDCLRNPFKPWDSPDNQRTERRWARTQRFWNGVSRFKFLAAEPLHVAEPTPGERASARWRSATSYPDIPIDGLVVADHFPTNEVDPIVLKFIEVEERIAHRFPPAADGLPQIPADPHVALDAAYPARYRQRYRLPVRPPGYDELDLGILAVKSPYAYLLEKVGDGQYRWDLGDLDSGYELHPRLRAPSAIVEFATEVDGGGSESHGSSPPRSPASSDEQRRAIPAGTLRSGWRCAPPPRTSRWFVTSIGSTSWPVSGSPSPPTACPATTVSGDCSRRTSTRPTSATASSPGHSSRPAVTSNASSATRTPGCARCSRSRRPSSTCAR